MITSSLPYLSLAIWIPVLTGLLIMTFDSERSAALARIVGFVGAVLGFLVTLPLFTRFDVATSAMQFVELTPWIKSYNINYYLGIDGISMPFVLLNSLITLLVVIAAWQVIEKKVNQYLSAFLIMSGLMNGIFSALDGVLFYIFLEASLIPMYIVIGVWGGPNRVYAALKFFLYTLLGSFLVLIAFIYLYIQSGNSFDIKTWHELPLTLDMQILLFIAFFFGFAVKVPMWPIHTWLPDAHVEAPTGGSVVLAAIMLKLGGYGFIRFSLPIAPDASLLLAPLMITLSLIAIVYIGLVALAQTDMKKLIAYSSIAHMGFVTLGFFMFQGNNLIPLAVEGALIQMISHGFVSGALFLCIGVMYDRMHSRSISDYGGIVNTMPKFAALFMLFAMANCGLPATSGFVGEFMVILGSMKASFWITFVAATTLIWGAAYTLWMYKRVVFGPIGSARVEALKDIGHRELFVLTILAIAVLGMGIYPLPFTEAMHASVVDLVRHVAAGKL